MSARLNLTSYSHVTFLLNRGVPPFLLLTQRPHQSKCSIKPVIHVCVVSYMHFFTLQYMSSEYAKYTKIKFLLVLFRENQPQLSWWRDNVESGGKLNACVFTVLHTVITLVWTPASVLCIFIFLICLSSVKYLQHWQCLLMVAMESMSLFGLEAHFSTFLLEKKEKTPTEPSNHGRVVSVSSSQGVWSQWSPLFALRKR